VAEARVSTFAKVIAASFPPLDVIGSPKRDFLSFGKPQGQIKLSPAAFEIASNLWSRGLRGLATATPFLFPAARSGPAEEVLIECVVAAAAA
jgi:hypothetical protein